MDGSRVGQDGEVDEDVDLEHANPELESPLKLQQGAGVTVFMHGVRRGIWRVGKVVRRERRHA